MSKEKTKPSEKEDWDTRLEYALPKHITQEERQIIMNSVASVLASQIADIKEGLKHIAMYKEKIECEHNVICNDCGKCHRCKPVWHHPSEKEDLEQGLRDALRWPEEIDILSLDGDSRGSMEKAVAYVEKLLASQIADIKEGLKHIAMYDNGENPKYAVSDVLALLDGLK